MKSKYLVVLTAAVAVLCIAAGQHSGGHIINSIFSAPITIPAGTAGSPGVIIGGSGAVTGLYQGGTNSTCLTSTGADDACLGSGSFSSTTNFRTAAGSNSATSYGELSHVGNGMYFPSTTTVGFAANGTEAAGLSSTQVSLLSLSQLASKDFGGTCAMSSGTTCTFTLLTTYTTPACSATVQGSTPIAGACGVSGTTVTITAASSNSATWAAIVFGNPN